MNFNKMIDKAINISYNTNNSLLKLIGKTSVWLTQKQMAELFDKDRRTITRHIQR